MALISRSKKQNASYQLTVCCRSNSKALESAWQSNEFIYTHIYIYKYILVCVCLCIRYMPIYYAEYVELCLNKSLESFLLCFSIAILFTLFKFLKFAIHDEAI